MLLIFLSFRFSVCIAIALAPYLTLTNTHKHLYWATFVSFPLILFSLSIVFRWQHQDEQQKQKYQHSSTAPHTAPLTSKKHFPFDAPSSPRSVQTIQKNEALFTFDKHVDSIDENSYRGGGYENGGSKVIVDGNKVYYHGSSNYKCDNKISNGNGGDARYRGHDKLAMEKENACTTDATSPMQRLKHLTDDSYYNDQTYCSSYSKYSRRDGSWKSRHERHGSSSNKSSNSSNKATKPYPSEYAAYTKSGSTSNKKHSDDTMFPFDRAATYDAGGDGSGGGGGGGGGGTSDWAKRPSYASSYYDSPSPDGNSGDYYEKFRNAQQRKSTASTTSADGRALKELSRKQSLKMSKYDLPPSPSSIKSYNDHNHKFKNHISETDAFNLPIAKSNARTNSITSTDHSTTNSHATSPNMHNACTTTTTATIHGNATTISIVNQSPNNCANDRNQISQFDQIASKFDKIPSRSPHDCKSTKSPKNNFILFSSLVVSHLKSQLIYSKTKSSSLPSFNFSSNSWNLM